MPGGAAAKRTVRMPWSSSSCIARAAVASHGTSGGSPPSAVFSGDGHLVATASFDGTARLWRVASGEQVAVLRGASGARVLSNDIR